MPVGAWELEYGCTTLADPNRTGAYVANSQSGAYESGGVNLIAPVKPSWSFMRVNCGCDALDWTAPEPGDTPVPITPYTTPALDPAPWYSAAVPESAHFMGFIVERIQDVSTVPVTRSVTDRMTSFGGSSLGARRLRGRTMKVTLLAFGAYEAALDWGFRWLADTLASDECGLCDMTIRTACPVWSGESPTFAEWDTGRWTFKEVGLTEGPFYEEPPSPANACNFRRVSFTVVAQVPYGFKCPTEVVSDLGWTNPVWALPSALEDALLWFDAEAYADTDGTTVKNLGTAGATLDGTLGNTGALAVDSDPLHIAYDGVPYTHVPIRNSNLILIDDAADFDARPIDIVARISGQRLTNTSEVSLLVKADAATVTFEWALVLDNGRLRFTAHNVSTSWSWLADDVIPTTPAGSTGFAFDWMWIRVRTDTDGKCWFYYAPDSNTLPAETEWISLNQTPAALGNPWVAPVSTELYMGAEPFYASNAYIGHVNFAQVMALDTNYVPFMVYTGDETNALATTGTTTDGNHTWTISSNSNVGAPIRFVSRSWWWLDEQNYIQVPDNAVIDFGNAQDFTLMMVVQRKSTAAITRTALLSKISPGNPLLGWRLGIDSVPASPTDHYAVGTVGNGVATVTSGYINTWTSSPSELFDGDITVIAVTREADVWTAWSLEYGQVTVTEYDPAGTGALLLDTSNTGNLFVGWNPSFTNSPFMAMHSTMVWNRALSAAEFEEFASNNALWQIDSVYTAAPSLEWICDNNVPGPTEGNYTNSVCQTITASNPAGGDALIIEVVAEDADIYNLLITVTPDPFGYECGVNPPPSGWVPSAPCDRILLPFVPKNTTVRYDSAVQSVTLIGLAGETYDATSFVDTSSGTPPSFPVLSNGTYCVCIGSQRCSWYGGDGFGTVTMWTVHRELAV